MKLKLLFCLVLLLVGIDLLYARGENGISYLEPSSGFLDHMSNLSGTPIQVVDINLKDSQLFLLAMQKKEGQDPVYLCVNFYLKEKEKFKFLFSQDFPSQILLKNEKLSWVSLENMEGPTKQTIILRPPCRPHARDFFIYNFDVRQKSLTYCGSPDGRIANVEDVDKDGIKEIVSCPLYVDDNGGYPPTIYHLINNELMDVSDQFPSFFHDLAKKNLRALKELKHEKEVNEAMVEAQEGWLLRSYLKAGMKLEARRLARDIFREMDSPPPIRAHGKYPKPEFRAEENAKRKRYIELMLESLDN